MSPAQIALCAEEPSSHGLRDLGPAGERRGEPPSGWPAGKRVVEVGQELGQLLGEVVGRGLAAVALQRERRHRVGARGAADAEVDAAREQAGEHAEGLARP